jgi:hypothetical protein
MKNEGKNNTPNSIAKLERLVRYKSLEAQGYNRPDTPVDISVHSVRRRRIDVANTSEKAATDGIVRAGILYDDGPNQVSTIKFSQEKGQEEMTVITIEWGCEK